MKMLSVFHRMVEIEGSTVIRVSEWLRPMVVELPSLLGRRSRRRHLISQVVGGGDDPPAGPTSVRVWSYLANDRIKCLNFGGRAKKV
jgi:hypothetical protein